MCQTPLKLARAVGVPVGPTGNNGSGHYCHHYPQGSRNLESVESRILDNLPSVRQMRGPEAQPSERTQSIVYLLETNRQRLTKLLQ